MRRRRTWCVVAGGVLIAVSGLSARADEPTTQQMMDKINALQAKVDQLQGQQQQTIADQQAVAQQVLADSSKHTQLMDLDGMTAGYDEEANRFFIKSADGSFLLRPWIHIQVRDSTSYRVMGASHSSDTENGFEIRRARLGFDGNLFSPNFTYFINWATYRENSTGTVAGATGETVPEIIGGLPVLEEAWVKYHFGDTPYYIKAGQMHDPLDHEAIVGSKYREPEVSLTGDIFANTDTFTQAATFIYDPKTSIRFEGGVTDGIRAANTNFEDSPVGNGIHYDWGVAGRAEYKAMGNWHDYDQLTSLNDKDDLMVFGLGVDDSEGSGPYFNSLSHTLDAQYATTNGLFFYGSYFGRYTEHNPGIPSGAPVSTGFGTPGVAGKDTYEYSALAQAAYLINGKFEPFVRYEYLHLAGTPAGSQNNVNEISVGANYYVHGHNVQLTGQVMYLPDGIPVNDDSNDVLISNNHAEIVIIAQVQLLL
jgi:hypothetical protein